VKIKPWTASPYVEQLMLHILFICAKCKKILLYTNYKNRI